MTPEPRIELQDVTKRFGGVTALEGVSLRIEAGSIHALVGENGAGKSTLGKLIAGAVTPDSGRILIDGRPVMLSTPRAALAHGVAAIAQELLLVPGLTVAENVFLGAEPRRAGMINRRALRRQYERLAADAGFNLPANQQAGGMRTAQQQQIEILRALAREAHVVVMDEPSAALSGPDKEHLHTIVRSLSQRGKTILLISHFLDEVLLLADTVTVLRDGHLVQTTPSADQTEDSLIRAMLGRPLDAVFPAKSTPVADARVVLSVDHLSGGGVWDASLKVRAGEIVGLAGLVGAGRTELARAVFGADRRQSGTVVLDGTALSAHRPDRSLRQGLAMIPESRQDDGLLLTRSVLENVSLASLAKYSRGGVVKRAAERSAAAGVVSQVALTGAGLKAPVMSLSGGNQQKLLFARALLRRPRALIADEPTRGVDVGAKRAIYDLLVDLARDGMGILLISSEVEELLGLSHRVLVMRRGRIVAELTGEGMTEPAILAAAFADPGAQDAA